MTLDPETEEILQEFLVESLENLDSLDQDLLRLEQDPHDNGSLNSAFRSLHTIKGTAGFVGLGRIEKVAHAGESLLSRLRDEGAPLSADGASALLSTVDALREMLDKVGSVGTDGDDPHQSLIDELTKLADLAHAAAVSHSNGYAAQSAEAVHDAEAAQASAPQLPQALAHATEPQATQAPNPSFATETPMFLSAGSDEGDDALESILGEITHYEDEDLPSSDNLNLSHAVAAREDDPSSQPDLSDLGTLSGTTVSSSVAPDDPITQDAPEHRPQAESTIRVDVGLLDRLMNLVGELVLARNQLLQVVGSQSDPTLSLACQRLSLITTELQASVMKTRMQPIGNVWSKFPRVVRDLARTCGKNVRLEMEGRETELDRTIIESIRDPLTHLLRNAVDHGIETPEDRLAVGKSPHGTLTLRAFHEGGYVTIEVSEDGAGIDPERVKSRALERGLVTAEQATHMNERELNSLIFLPGFSTAKVVSAVSGRGVGMDVVKTHVERIGGTVDVTSILGVGTTFHLKIPLTLAIVPALIVTSDNERYAIPQVSLLELVRLDGERGGGSLESVGGAPVFRRRGRLLPLVFLREELGSPRLPQENESLNVVVLQVEDQAFGLVVDAVNDSEEIVVKPLRGQLKDVPVFSGATIMGDGRVALILDVAGIARRSEATTEAHGEALAEQAANFLNSTRRTLLVLAAGGGSRVAVSLEQVSRLEQFSHSRIETTGGRQVVQYRDRLLPIINLSYALGLMSDAIESDLVEVVVVRVGKDEVGVAVDGILDIVEQEVVFEQALARDGILGSAVVAGHATEIVELETLVRRADPDLFEFEGMPR